MKIILYKPLPHAKRIKCYIPYQLAEIRSTFKQLNGAWYHPNQKLWSLSNTSANWTYLQHLFGPMCEIKESKVRKSLPSYRLSEEGNTALTSLENKLIVKGYSPNTIKTYRSMFGRFLHHFAESDVASLTPKEIESFIVTLIKDNNISTTFQNQMINAIKAYYEYVLGHERTFYKIERPKKSKELPAVLSANQVKTLLHSIDNIKHKAILTTIYSCGLRISEATRLRVQDIHSDEGYVFIKCAKGKKDRKTILSPALLQLLRQYYKKYKPSYWLFEGQTGEQYSVSSIRKIFKRACKRANINQWATVHTLRHSFATHLVQHGTNLRYIQQMMGHGSPKTTEIYTRTIQINSQSVQSPLDFL